MAHERLDTLSEHPQQCEFGINICVSSWHTKGNVDISEVQLLPLMGYSSIFALQDLLNIIYIDGNPSALLDPESTTNVNADKPGDGQTAESRTGIRTICVSPDGKHLASGDRNGMLR